MALIETLPPSSTATALQRGGSPLLRLQSDDRLVTLTRRGNQAAYETLVSRYQPRLLAFCRNMLSSKEDAEDVLQEVFTSAYGAMVADDRDINVRPWLYRIARNRSLNHMRKQTAIGVDSMDIHLADHGASTADRVHDREEFRELLGDVGELAEQQRTALLLREVDAMSYDQIAEAMDTTVPAVKSLLVRARIGLADAAQSRRISCDEVRHDLGAWAEGLAKLSPPVRKHVKDCHRCGETRSLLKQNNKRLAALFPIGPILLLKQLFFAQSAGHAATGAGAGAASGAAAASSGPMGAFSVASSALATKAAAGLATAAIVTGGAVEVQHVAERTAASSATANAVTPSRQTPVWQAPTAPHQATAAGGTVVAPAQKTDVVDKPSAAPKPLTGPPLLATTPGVQGLTPTNTGGPTEVLVDQEFSTDRLPDAPTDETVTDPVTPPHHDVATTEPTPEPAPVEPPAPPVAPGPTVVPAPPIDAPATDVVIAPAPAPAPPAEALPAL